ncbi:hypothetical protein GGQ22_14255 [Nocardioides sp. zg-579]|uniref:SRPBCC family protein n=1 Tax=Nocardioides marmotae TaxID=2663857 RepID=A0A6I3JDT2_9ACTN|nr:hypothetical protein [Nocardioides marmotae]MCR6032591.1 hypothetical protein [Gordonia jinghuaiqii]MTB96239.1 hypothetical protein [Nocardioides marmotae]QKD99693.1 hypothetical protein HPC71_00210 [Nocardioides marmotae]
MARFTSGTKAEAVVLAPAKEIWDVLTDPLLVAELTPLLKRIDASGEHWTWHMTGLDVLGIEVAPTFTERMSYRDLERIDFSHDPPAGASERAGVEGWYALTELPESEGGGTRLATSLDITLDLPLPKLSAPAVTAAMRGVIGQMGERFSRNLLAHLGAEQR